MGLNGVMTDIRIMVYRLIHEDGGCEEIGKVPLWRYSELKNINKGCVCNGNGI